ncbi:hypothetical protein IscW_ISCW020358 [Ixodes scapularis]|uniref:Uncharacterized protein n=1 Tax=Ixodes scapularis TaxID=6945 RepID=B7PZL6_IXOSC|nr:hypothetical protein IscW_ISCW020358 [Ixodes scapularis]|eukprot:XP_002405519.1 hypothetical protein IscW_ISCW020358 [Ixodes scapularis]
MESTYVTQRQRVKRLVKEGWLEVTQQSVLVLAELIRSVLNNAATKLEPKAGPSEQLTAAVEAACRAMGLASTEEGEASAAESNWGQVLAELGDYSISQTIIQELKDAYEYQGFDARLIVMRMGERGVSELHSEEGAAQAYVHRLTLVVIGLMRGANFDKVRKGMREENKTKLDKLNQIAMFILTLCH